MSGFPHSIILRYAEVSEIISSNLSKTVARTTAIQRTLRMTCLHDEFSAHPTSSESLVHRFAAAGAQLTLYGFCYCLIPPLFAKDFNGVKKLELCSIWSDQNTM